MSYTLDYRRLIFKFPGRLSQPDFLAVSLVGDNNVWSCDYPPKKARSWHFVAFGWPYSIIQKVCHYAGDCEGGMLTLRGRHCTPENYIKVYREALKNCLSAENFFSMFMTKEAYITRYKKNINELKESEYNWKQWQELKAHPKFKKENSEKEVKFIIELNSVEDIHTWLNFKSLGNWANIHLTNGEEV